MNCQVKRKKEALTLNVKAEGFSVNMQLVCENSTGEKIQLSPKGVNQINFGDVEVNEKAVRQVCMIVCFCSLVCSFVRLFVCLFFWLFVCFFVYSFVRLFVCSFVRLSVCSVVRLFVCFCFCLLLFVFNCICLLLFVLTCFCFFVFFNCFCLSLFVFNCFCLLLFGIICQVVCFFVLFIWALRKKEQQGNWDEICSPNQAKETKSRRWLIVLKKSFRPKRATFSVD